MSTVPEAGSARFARNSLGSLLRTFSGALLALLLPPVLIRQMGPEVFGVWAMGSRSAPISPGSTSEPSVPSGTSQPRFNRQATRSATAGS